MQRVSHMYQVLPLNSSPSQVPQPPSQLLKMAASSHRLIFSVTQSPLPAPPLACPSSPLRCFSTPPPPPALLTALCTSATVRCAGDPPCPAMTTKMTNPLLLLVSLNFLYFPNFHNNILNFGNFLMPAFLFSEFYQDFIS